MNSHKAAVIGLGRIASTIDEEIQIYDGHALPFSHIACYGEVPEVELVGMADTWEEQREAARQKWGFQSIHHDYRQMLRETKPDIVSVCTSTKPRAEVVLEIAGGGYGVKAIWAEKPISISLHEADQMIEACREAGIALAVNCLRRWRNDYRQALEMIRQGLIGDLLHVQALGNCGISHNGSHLLTALTMFAESRAEWVMGEARLEPSKPEDDFEGAGYVGFANGVRGYFRTFANGPNEWSLDVTGTKGMVRIIRDGWAFEHWTLEEPPEGMRRPATARRMLPPPLRWRSPGVNAIYDMVDCIESGGPPKCSGEDAREALEIALATRQSGERGGRKVELPLEDRSLRIIPREVLAGDIPRAMARRI